MAQYYILNPDHSVTPVPVEQWLLQHYNIRRVGLFQQDEWMVSTVFLGLNHSLQPGPPLIFETMVFAPDGNASDDHEMRRYSTWAEAEAGHERIANLLQHELANAASSAQAILKFIKATV